MELTFIKNVTSPQRLSSFLVTFDLFVDANVNIVKIGDSREVLGRCSLLFKGHSHLQTLSLAINIANSRETPPRVLCLWSSRLFAKQRPRNACQSVCGTNNKSSNNKQTAKYNSNPVDSGRNENISMPCHKLEIG